MPFKEVTMFKKILFATTASPTCDNAAHVAFDLANKYKSDLFVFHYPNYQDHALEFKAGLQSIFKCLDGSRIMCAVKYNCRLFCHNLHSAGPGDFPEPIDDVLG